MKKVNSILTALVLLFIMNIAVNAQETAINKPNRTTYSIETDPSTFAFNGYAIHLRVKPKNSDHLVLGLGVYAMDFPSILVDMNDQNVDQGWEVRLNQGLGLFGEYHFSEVNKKWFVGTQLAIQEYKIKNENISGFSEYNTMLLMGLGGYTLQPFSVPLYFKFWGGAGYTGQISGENTLGDKVYDIAPLLLFGALHVGYTF